MSAGSISLRCAAWLTTASYRWRLGACGFEGAAPDTPPAGWQFLASCLMAALKRFSSAPNSLFSSFINESNCDCSAVMVSEVCGCRGKVCEPPSKMPPADGSARRGSAKKLLTTMGSICIGLILERESGFEISRARCAASMCAAEFSCDSCHFFSRGRLHRGAMVEQRFEILAHVENCVQPRIAAAAVGSQRKQVAVIFERR